jgi:fluoroacetyl-CoA thioesterase
MPAHLANQFKDAMLPQVFATPMMITAMENAALNAIRGYLDPGESAVGTAVDIRHLAATPAGQQVTAEAEVTAVEIRHIAATPVGHEVTAHAEVTAVDGRRIAFNVSARDETEEIGRGTHERMVVDMRRLDERLAAKSKPKT